MDFALTDEERSISDAARRYVERNYGFERYRHLAADAVGFKAAHWDLLAELGILGLNVPAEFGGLEAGPIETYLVMEQLGRGLVLEPVISTAVLAARLLTDAGTDDQKALLLPSIAEGRERLAFAILERGARFEHAQVSATARREGDAWLLDGSKVAVVDAAGATNYVVTAGVDSQKPPFLFVVPVETEGLQADLFSTIDGRRVANLTLRNLKLPLSARLGKGEEAFAALDRALDHANCALCAEACGVMDALFQITGEYVRARKQFGQEIGRFQAVQHRIADMLSAIEQARSATLMATSLVDSDDPVARKRAVSVAKSLVCDNGKYVGEQAIQLHGAIGMTDEASPSHYFKRLTAIQATWGNSHHHVERYASLLPEFSNV